MIMGKWGHEGRFFNVPILKGKNERKKKNV